MEQLPYEFGAHEVPQHGTAITEGEGHYPLLKQIEDRLYPEGRVAMVPQMVSIHKRIRERIDKGDLIGEPEPLYDEEGREVDVILRLKPEAAARIADSVVSSYGRS